jgi:hypothetical protein
MPQPPRRHETMPHQDHQRYGAGLARHPLAILPGLQTDVTGLTSSKGIFFGVYDGYNEEC